MVPGDVLQGGGVGGFVKLRTGDGTAFLPGAQQQAQGAAAGAQIQNGGVLRQPHKIRQHHRIGAQGKAEGQIQGIFLQNYFHNTYIEN